MDLVGKSPINPILFYTGKFAGYITWILLLLEQLNVFTLFHGKLDISVPLYLCYLCETFAALLIVISILNLGKSTRLGLPTEETKLHTTGLYQISRNPMYLGFDLLTISSMIYTMNYIVFIMGIYSIVVYHFIILGEERFLESRFGTPYFNYKSRVHRYF